MNGSGDYGCVSRISDRPIYTWYKRFWVRKSIDDLEVLRNDVIADVEEFELFGEDVDGDSGRPAKSAAALIVVKDRVEAWPVAVEEILVALVVVETCTKQQQFNETQMVINDSYYTYSLVAFVESRQLIKLRKTIFIAMLFLQILVCYVTPSGVFPIIIIQNADI